MREYIADNPQLCQLLRGSEALEVESLLDGVINIVFKGEAMVHQLFEQQSFVIIVAQRLASVLLIMQVQMSLPAVQGGSLQQSAVIKQALPYVRAVGESFPLSRVRFKPCILPAALATIVRS